MDNANGGAPAPAPYGTWQNPSYAEPLTQAQIDAQTQMFGHADNPNGTAPGASPDLQNGSDSSGGGYWDNGTGSTSTTPTGSTSVYGDGSGYGPNGNLGQAAWDRRQARMADPKMVAKIAGAMGPAPGVPGFVPGFGIGRGMSRLGNFNQVQQLPAQRANPNMLQPPLSNGATPLGPVTTTWNNQGY